MTRPDLIIIGGGIAGAASAYFASRAGFKPMVLEKRAALGTLTTSASLAAFRAQFAEPENIRMMLESIAFYEAVSQETDIGLTQQGYLFVTTLPDGFEQCTRRVELQRSLGLDDVELLSGAEARERFPYLSPEVTAATFRARDGWLSAHELTYYYARASRAQICLETKVEHIMVEAGAVRGVKTDHGTIDCPRVVVAAGPYSRDLAAGLGLALPIDLVRRQRVAIKGHPLIPREAPMTIDSDTGAHWRPDGRGAVLAWALPEAPGEARDDVAPDWEFPAVVLDGVSRTSPFWGEVAAHLRQSDIDLRAGQYDMTPDAKPIIGGCPTIRGLYFSCGYSGHGVMASAGGARLLADLLTGELAEAENPFQLGRFQEDKYHREGERMVL